MTSLNPFKDFIRESLNAKLDSCSTPESDLENFVALFTDARFQPDMLKIYPTIVVKNTQLYDWWVKGEYTPYDSDQIVDLVARAVNKMPEYVRIQRMQRDIPLHQVEAGLNKGNLRELVNQEMSKRELRNPTIRYREIGHFQMLLFVLSLHKPHGVWRIGPWNPSHQIS